MARTHVKHPEDEIYADLRPELDERGLEQFDTELQHLAHALMSDASDDTVQEAYDEVLHEIAELRDHASAGDRLRGIVGMVRTAAEEYGVGVKDGAVVNAHEYQDAWGFLQAARDEAEKIAESGDEQAAAAAREIIAQLDTTAPLFAGIVPPERIDADASVLWGAAARMEIAALPVT
jgi:hypothetical protein